MGVALSAADTAGGALPWAYTSECDVVVAQGSEAREYLHGQITQDVADLAAGEARLSLLLEPKGLVEGLFGIWAVSDSTSWLNTAVGAGEAVAASLARFKLRTDVDFSVERGWLHQMRQVAEGAQAAPNGGGELDLGAWGEPNMRTTPAASCWPLWSGTDALELGDVPSVGWSAQAGHLDDSSYQWLRTIGGLPGLPSEIEPGWVPNDTGLLDLAVSFTKGCYRGQELVERIDSRAARARGIVRCASDGPLAAGDALTTADGVVVAEVLSAALTEQADESLVAEVAGCSQLSVPTTGDEADGASVRRWHAFVRTNRKYGDLVASRSGAHDGNQGFGGSPEAAAAVFAPDGQPASLSPVLPDATAPV